MDWPLRALSSSKPPRSRLLDLPAELRTYIFELSVTSEKPLVTFRLDKYQQDTLQEATQPALTRASKQLRSESLLLFYNSNTFILHTEGVKAEQGYMWAQCNESYLKELIRITLRLRFMALTHSRSESNGAFAVSLRRAKAGDRWCVGDHWHWASVTRKPSGVSLDAGFVMGSLRRMVAENPARMDTADDVYATVTDLRLLYLEDKMS